MKLSTLVVPLVMSLAIGFNAASQEIQPNKPTSNKKDTVAIVKPKSTKVTKAKTGVNQTKVSPPAKTKPVSPSTTPQPASTGKDTKGGNVSANQPSIDKTGIPEVKGSTPVITPQKNGSINWTQQ